MTVVITPTRKALGTYQASIRIVANSPVFGQEVQTIPVSMSVVDEIQGMYLPAIFR